MGGLTAAIRLARHGFRVQLLEARSCAGGLASRVEAGGFSFDAGPYVLLDRPGLEWSFRQLGLDLEEHVDLRPINDVYAVTSPGTPPVRILRSLEETAGGLDRSWPGSGARYISFVRAAQNRYARLQPLQWTSRPGWRALWRTGAWRDVPFLLRPLSEVLARTGLPAPVRIALGIWTHVASQKLSEAPSPLAFVPALIHGTGAYYPARGIGAIPEALRVMAASAGVEVCFDAKAASIRCQGGRVSGVEVQDGGVLPADAVVSNAGGHSTYLRLLPAVAPRLRSRLKALPLQSPGVSAYLAVRGLRQGPYLRFFLPGGGDLCRLFVACGQLAPKIDKDGWTPARLIAPMDHAAAEAGGAAAQTDYLDRVLAEHWWQDEVAEHRVLATRIPVEWGREFRLYKDSMNPVMTARLLRSRRMPHRCPHVRGLYLAGSSTHPGQWVSFCAVSGILAADCVREDLA
jgi:phytoene dehydrogenase-like protein